MAIDAETPSIPITYQSSTVYREPAAKSNIKTMVSLRPDFTSKFVLRLAIGTPKFCIAPYDKVSHELVNLGPVVQSIVSLTSLLRGQLVKCFTTL